MKDLFIENKTDIIFRISSLLMCDSVITLLLFYCFMYLLSVVLPENHTITTFFAIIFAFILLFLLNIVFIILPLSYITNFVILFIKLFSKNKTKKDYIIILTDLILLVIFAFAIAAEVMCFYLLESLSEVKI